MKWLRFLFLALVVGRRGKDPQALRNKGLICTTPRIYSSNATELPHELPTSLFISRNNVQVIDYIDSGRYSTVFNGVLKRRANQEQRVVLKVLKPHVLAKIKREVSVLNHLTGTKGVVQLLGVTKSDDVFTILFEHLGPDYHVLSLPHHNLTKFDIQVYMYKLLEALEQCHMKGIMHRDIKSRNILFNKVNYGLKLIDFGLSDVYVPRKEYNPSVASRHYKSPELLLNYYFYDYAIDIWSAGCVFAGLMFAKDPFFFDRGTTSTAGVGVGAASTCIAQLASMAKVVGSSKLLSWAKKFRIKLTVAQKKAIGNCPVPASGFESFVNERNRQLCEADALDLLGKMLTVDHVERYTARECLAHKWFDVIRPILAGQDP